VHPAYFCGGSALSDAASALFAALSFFFGDRILRGDRGAFFFSRLRFAAIFCFFFLGNWGGGVRGRGGGGHVV
jgi:hypothetical protein